MKRCPTCNSTFDDEALSYCINDGTVLVRADEQERADAQAPTIFAEPRPTSNVTPPPTMEYGAMQPGKVQTPPQAYRWANQTPSWTPPPPPAPIVGGPSQGTAVASLVLGLVSITVGWCCNFGVVAGPVAVGLGIFALVQIKNNPRQYTGKPLAIIGIVSGGLSFIGMILIIILYGLSFALGGFK